MIDLLAACLDKSFRKTHPFMLFHRSTRWPDLISIKPH